MSSLSQRESQSLYLICTAAPSFLLFLFFIAVKHKKGLRVCHPQILHSGITLTYTAERNWEEADTSSPYLPCSPPVFPPTTCCLYKLKTAFLCVASFI